MLIARKHDLFMVFDVGSTACPGGRERPIRLADLEPSGHGSGVLSGPDAIPLSWAEEARKNKIDPNLAVQLSQWGEFKILGRKSFSLEIGRKKPDEPTTNGDHTAFFIVDGRSQIASIVVQVYKEGKGWVVLSNHPNIPYSDVKIQRWFEEEKLVVISSFGIFGRMWFGITKEGAFTFNGPRVP